MDRTNERANEVLTVFREATQGYDSEPRIAVAIEIVRRILDVIERETAALWRVASGQRK